jgi:flagellar basal-body rod modification protein FlgD
MSTSGVNSNSSAAAAAASSSSSSTASPFSNLSLNDFVTLLVTELQQQDPTQPVDNSTILNEVGQMDSISSNMQLNTTMQSMQLGQDVNTGSSLLGKTVTGIDTNNNSVNGVVNSVTVASGQVQLNVGSQVMNISNVASIVGSSSSTSGS